MSTVLGLDLGSDSIGWALVDRESERIIASGVRLFRTGEGGDETPNQTRRAKRLARRQRRYRIARYRTLTDFLISGGLLPEFLPNESRHDYLNRVDKQVLIEMQTALSSGEVTLPAAYALNSIQRLPYAACYFLRYFCSKFKCKPHWYGRAILHMARFRGFSYQVKTRDQVESEAAKNRDSDVKGEVLKARLEREGKILAQEFIERCIERKGIRGNRFTSRFSLKDEFKCLSQNVLEYYPELSIYFSTNQSVNLESLLFKQRGITVKRSTIGRCSIFPNSERASKLLPESQEFKIRQALANIRLFGAVDGGVRPLTSTESEKVYTIIQSNGKISKTEFFKVIGLNPRSKESIISSNFDEMKNHLIDSLVIILKGIDELSDGKCRCSSWDSALRKEFACALLRFNNKEAAERHLVKRFNLTEEQAMFAMNHRIPNGRMAHSSKALRHMNSELTNGRSPHLIRESLGARVLNQGLGKLIPVVKAFPTLRDPAVIRTLSQLRKVVNAVVDKYGKPGSVRIELARSRKLSQREQNTITRLNKRLKNERDEIAQWLLGNQIAASDTNVLKFRLWRESSHQCLYCGSMLSCRQVFSTSDCQIDHIWPYSRTLDDRYINKLLVCSGCNQEKGNATPYEKWGSDVARWRDIASRFDSWADKKVAEDEVFRDLSESLRNLAGGNRISAKRRRVLEQSSILIEGFLARQLHTTGYASRLARDYLNLLYSEQNKVNVSSGFITGRYRFALRQTFAAQVRSSLPLLLDADAQKTRDDHRHHAFDAVFIALSDDRARMALQREWADGHKTAIPAPWSTFGDDLAASLESINPVLYFPQRDAHRISGKVDKSGSRHRGQLVPRGSLHDEMAKAEDERGSRSRSHPAQPSAYFNIKENAFVMIGQASDGSWGWKAMSLWDWCDRVRAEGYNYPASFILEIRKRPVEHMTKVIWRLHEVFSLNGDDRLWRLVNASDSEFLFIPLNDARTPLFLRDNRIAVRITGRDKLMHYAPAKIQLSQLGDVLKPSIG